MAAGQPQGVPHAVALDVDLPHQPHVVHEPVLRRTDRHLDGLVVPAHGDVEHPGRVVRVRRDAVEARCGRRRAGRAPAGTGGRCGGPARRPRGPRRRVPPARTPRRASTAPPRPSAARCPTRASRVCGSVTAVGVVRPDERVGAVGPPQAGHARDRPRRRGQRVQADQAEPAVRLAQGRPRGRVRQRSRSAVGSMASVVIGCSSRAVQSVRMAGRRPRGRGSPRPARRCTGPAGGRRRRRWVRPRPAGRRAARRPGRPPGARRRGRAR